MADGLVVRLSQAWEIELEGMLVSGSVVRWWACWLVHLLAIESVNRLATRSAPRLSTEASNVYKSPLVTMFLPRWLASWLVLLWGRWVRQWDCRRVLPLAIEWVNR